MSLTVLGDLAVFWFYVTLICFFTLHYIVHCRLDYCNSALSRVAKVYVQKLQFVQNMAACMVSVVCRCEHFTPVLEDLNWLPVSQQVVFKMASMVRNFVHGVAPAYLGDLWLLVSCVCHHYCVTGKCFVKLSQWNIRQVAAPCKGTWVRFAMFLECAAVLVTGPLPPQDHKSGTICRPISDSVGCHTAISGSRWRYFYSDSETTVQCELFLTAPNRNILTYLLSCAFLLAVKVRFVLVAGVRHRRLWVAEAAEILLGLGARQLCRPHVELSLRLRLWISRMFTTSSHYPTHGQPAILIRYLYYSNVCCHKFDDM